MTMNQNGLRRRDDSLEHENHLPDNNDISLNPPKLNHKSLPSHCCRIILILVGFLHCSLSSGMVFGWASLELILRHEGTYERLCQKGNDTMLLNQNQMQQWNDVMLLEDSHGKYFDTKMSLDDATRTQQNDTLIHLDADSASLDKLSFSESWKSHYYSVMAPYSEQQLMTRVLEGFSWVPSHENHLKQYVTDDSEGIHDSSGDAVHRGDTFNGDVLQQHSQSLLENEHPVSSSDDDEIINCHERSLMFEQIFTAGAVAVNLSQLFSGFFLDYFGPKITCMTTCVVLASGILLFGFSNDTTFQAFIPAYILIGIGGPPVQLAVLHLSNLYPSWKSMIKSIVSGLFGLSSLVFFIFLFIYEHFGVSRQWIFIGYCGVVLFIAVSGAILWPFKSYLLDEVILLSNAEATNNSLDFYIDEDEDDSLPQQSINAEDKPEKENDVIVTESSSAVIPFSPRSRESFFRQLFSLEMMFMIVFMCISILRMNYFAGTMDTQLYEKSANNREAAELSAKVFAIIASCGFVGIPIIGLSLDKGGLFFSSLLVATTNFLFNALFVAPYNATWFESIIFVLYSVSRPFLYSLKYAYLSDIFGFSNFGKLVGICNFTIGLFTTLQFLINYIVKEFFEGSHFWVNAVFAVLGLLGYVFSMFILVKVLQYRAWRKEQRDASERTYLLATDA